MTHLRIKICGITSPEDARAAGAAGADAIGLNFHQGGPRCIDLATAKRIMQVLPPFVEPVAVFTDPTTLGQLYLNLGCRYIQWHGELDDMPEFSPGALAMFRLIVAFRIGDRASIAAAQRWINARSNSTLPAAILIDGYKKDMPGGTGTVVPWSLLADIKPRVPLILAGGLTPENVAEAVRTVRPYAVDVASGVESSPGKKDMDKIKRFIDNARSAIA
jgi:phosphoribosylanthranilate isomerase